MQSLLRKSIQGALRRTAHTYTQRQVTHIYISFVETCIDNIIFFFLFFLISLLSSRTIKFLSTRLVFDGVVTTFRDVENKYLFLSRQMIDNAVKSFVSFNYLITRIRWSLIDVLRASNKIASLHFVKAEGQRKFIMQMYFTSRGLCYREHDKQNLDVY